MVNGLQPTGKRRLSMSGKDAARLIVHKLLEMAWQTEVDGGDSMQEISTAIAVLEAITNGVFDGEYEYTPKSWKSHHKWVDEVVSGNEWIHPWSYAPIRRELNGRYRNYSSRP